MIGDKLSQLEDFYVETHQLLEKLWAGEARMIHFGFYPDPADTKSVSQQDSLIETVRQAASRLNLQSGQYVLDAGCGLGGPAVWLAKTYNVRVQGISNLQLHVDQARQHADDNGILSAESCMFEVGDYTQTRFEDNTFDAVMCIESICYARNKLAVLRELFRVLKPGGRISILDAFRTKRDIPAEDEKVMKSWLTGWGAHDIDTIEEFTAKAQQVGFVNRKFEDLQQNFRPSHEIAYKSARFLTPVLAMLHKVRLVSEVKYGYCRACRDAYLAGERGLCVQGIFSASK